MTNQEWPELAPPYKLKQCRHGLFLYNVNDMFIGKALDLYGEYGEAEVSLFKQIIHPGYLVLDIGANIGTHTVYFARQVGSRGRVYAFEPQRIVFQQLVANIALNSLMNVDCKQLALGTEHGVLHVPPINYMQTNNFGGVNMTEQNVGEAVTVLSLDELDLPACHVIKLDVEGMEKHVLEGAAHTIKKYRPLIYTENDRQDKSAELISYIDDLNYEMYWHLPRLFNNRNFFQNPENIYKNIVSINMLCIPREYSMSITNMKRVQGPDDDWHLAPASEA
ncbi:MAG: FkbM family methyltransferase [Gammaproteobacteria bacterium]